MKVPNLLRINLFRAVMIMIFGIVAAGLSAGAEYIFKFAVDAVSRGNFSRYLWWQLVSLIVTIGSAFLTIFATYLFKKQNQAYVLDTRNQLVRKFTLTKKHYDLTDIQNRLQNNLDTLSTNFLDKYFAIYSNLLLLVFATGTLLSLHWSLVLLAFMFGLINLLLLPKIMQSRTATAVAQASYHNQLFLAAINDWMNGLAVLRQFNLAHVFKDYILKSGAKLSTAKVHETSTMAATNLIEGFGNTLGQTLFAFAAGILFFQKLISIGGFIVACGFAYTIFSALTELSYAISTVKATKPLGLGIAEVWQAPDGPKAAVRVASVIGQNIQVRVNQHQVLTYPDFTIQPGQKVLLKGDSGTGKSTLLKVILGQIKPDKGSIILKDAQGQVIQVNQARMAYLAQDLFLFPGSISDNITMFHAVPPQQVSQAVAAVGLTTDISSFKDQLELQLDPDQLFLSGGQQQKVVLARSLVYQNELVLMDEPTSAIDCKATEQILRKLTSAPNTLIFVGHNLSAADEALFTQTIDLDAWGKRK